MANLPRITQSVVELILNENGPVRNSQSVVEVIGNFFPIVEGCDTEIAFRSGRTSMPLVWIELMLSDETWVFAEVDLNCREVYHSGYKYPKALEWFPIQRGCS